MSIGSKLPFSETLRYLNKGACNDEITEKIAQLVKAVRETGKKGTVALTLEIDLMSGSEDMMKIGYKVALKAPEHPAGATVMYSTYDGDLLRDDPAKQERTELRQVEDESRGPLKTVSEELKTLKTVNS